MPELSLSGSLESKANNSSMSNLSTAVWNLLHGRPIPQHLIADVVSALRKSPEYLKKTTQIAGDDYSEALTPRLEKYVEEYRRSPNQSGSIKPKFIVLHHSAGGFRGTVSWIMDPASDVSYHYVINPKDGSRIQHVFDTRKAWHAGRSSWRGYTGLNSHSIGIAFDRNTNTRTPSGVEIDSCAWKCVYLMGKFNLSPGDIITHEQIAKGRKDDVSEETHRLVLDRVSELLTS